MIECLAKLLIKGREQKEEPEVRKAYGILCGSVGIFLNICLFAGKFLAGTLTGAISITADAFNNLSDAASSAVTLLGFQLAGAKPDRSHPFGHGRIEYVSGLIVSGAILLMAVELVKSSVGKILSPKAVEYNTMALVILGVSILVKLYMFYYNRSIGSQIGSAAMRATAMDSLSDCRATLVVLAASLLGKHTGLYLDGYCGVLVGAFIFYTGIQAAKETLDPLLGQAPDEEFVRQIEELVMAHQEVCGIHDLIVHDYGPGRRMISLHAEIPADGDLLTLHDAIDNIEAQLRRELHCDAVIHMDPVVTADAHINYLKSAVEEVLKEVDPHITMHDFRVVTGPTHTSLIFDIVVPFRFQMKDEEVTEAIQGLVARQLGEQHFCVIQVDKAYVKE